MKILLVVNMVSVQVVNTSWSSADSIDIAEHLLSGVQSNVLKLHKQYACLCSHGGVSGHTTRLRMAISVCNGATLRMLPFPTCC